MGKNDAVIFQLILTYQTDFSGYFWLIQVRKESPYNVQAALIFATVGSAIGSAGVMTGDTRMYLQLESLENVSELQTGIETFIT